MKKSLFLVSLLLAFSANQAEARKIVLTSNNTLILDGVVTPSVLEPIVEKAKKIDSKLPLSKFINQEPIYLFLNTPGGEIQTGLQFIEFLKGLNRPVHTITQTAASMGFQIAQNLGERYILSHGILMSHRARGGVQGEFGGKEPSQLTNRINFWSKRILEMDLKTVQRTKGKQTLDSYTTAYTNELWLTGQEAVILGYADELVNVSCDSSLDGMTEKSIKFLGFTFVQKSPNCPIAPAADFFGEFFYTVKKARDGSVSEGGLMTVDQFLSKGGVFGPDCLYNPHTSLCTADPSVTPQKVEDAKQQVLDRQANEYKYIVPYQF